MIRLARSLKSASISTSAVLVSGIVVVLVLFPALAILLILLESQNKEIADQRWREISSSLFVLAEIHVERYDYAAVVELVDTLHRKGTSPYLYAADAIGVKIAEVGELPEGGEKDVTTFASNLMTFSMLRPHTGEAAIGTTFLILFVSVPAVSIIFLSALQFLFFKRILVNPLVRMSEEVTAFRDEKMVRHRRRFWQGSCSADHRP